jgi:diguanylate cyclase (GGDEF)-like protein
MKIMVATYAADEANELRKILKQEGHESVIVDQSIKTIDAIYHENPEMVMLDMALENPSAVEILAKLKSAPSTREIPVIVISQKKSTMKIAKCYELGAYDYISKPFFKEEIAARMRNIGYVCEKMKELEKLLVRDYLTGLYNRKFFMERFVEELAWAGRYNEPLSFMILDIDHFKKINDTYGHSCGDEVLRQLAKTLSTELRAHDILARYGGEEFVILLSNTTLEEACEAAEKLRKAVQSASLGCDQNNIKIPVSISIGVSSTDNDFDPVPDRLIVRGDRALYEAKAAGRNRVMFSLLSGEIRAHEV